MQQTELAVLDWIAAHCQNPLFDAIFPIISRICDHGEIWIVLLIILLAIKQQRRTGGILATGLILEFVTCNKIIKPLVGRVRPFVVNPDAALIVTAPHDASFPSGHTAFSFAAVFALKGAGSPLWKPALVFSLIMAFSRLYLYVHWPSDVICGAILGSICGILAPKLFAWIEAQIAKRKKAE